ncbi:glycosyltransferase family 4 protein [Frondihabitans cladoniiphilus]|uniref:Glycosyltransferase subfamily 4-like N-terminal domain-containing protein n=1 Tax=Frondihabitans cladoniiphilus TaxID=715785 RepID=A0ABP8VX01_9MICO
MTPAPDGLKIVTLAIELEPVGGIESVTLEDSRELIARGHSVEMLYSVDGSQRPEYEAAGITLSGPWLYGVQGPNAVAALRQIPALVRHLRRERPDVLWLSRSEFLPWAQLVSRLSGVPVLCHIHNVPNFRITSLLARGIGAFVVVSDAMRRQWIAAGLKPETVTVLHNGVAPEDYPFAGVEERDAVRNDLGLPAGVPIVLYLGRITGQKGVPTLLESWRLVHEQHPDAHLLLVGAPEPSEVEECREALAALPESSWSWRPLAKDVIPYLHAADVVVLPSTYQDPLPRVVLETLATGRPMVASRVGGIPEMLSGDLARWLVEPGDAKELAERLGGLLEWREREPAIAEEARAAVERDFPITAHVDGLERALRRVSKRRGDWV